MHNAQLLLKQMWYEIMEAATPGEPFVGSTFRLLTLDLDAHFLQTLHDVTTLDEIIRTPVHVHIVNLLVELVSIGEHTIISRLEVYAKDSSAESSNPCELVKIAKHEVEGLVSTP